MNKKIVVSIVVAILLVSVLTVFVACDKTTPRPEPTANIVFLGDSIAEALIGPSPLSERDNYGYYALVGRANNLRYYNHAVSGHMTSGSMVNKQGDGLLQVISREDETGVLINTHIAQADIVHISVLGNNILQYSLAALLLEMADMNDGIAPGSANSWYQKCFEGHANEVELKAKFTDTKYLFEHMHDGSDESVLRPGIAAGANDTLLYGESEGATDDIFAFPSTYNDIEAIIARVRELNPDAKIIFQKVYNPVFDGTRLIKPAEYQALAERGFDTTAKLRDLAQDVLDNLNGILDEYNEKHPTEQVFILDVNKVFDDVTKMDVNEDGSVNLSVESLGRSLIYADYTHPSNFGHAIIAGATQALFESTPELKQYVSSDAVSYYKSIRTEQLDRMFAPIKGFDVKAAKKAVENAATFNDVTFAYFKAIAGYKPIYC